MKNMKKILLTMVAAMLLVVMSVAGTLAYLTSTSQEVKNTFSVGNVNIKLDEAKVTGDGTTLATPAERVLENTYKLQPGLTYLKDPTVTVEKGSEACYVRMQVTITDYSKLQSAFPDAEYWDGNVFLLEKLVDNTWDKATWMPQVDKLANVTKNDTSVTYEFWYKDTVAQNNADDTVLDDLFEKIKMPDDMTNTELSFLKDLKINVIAHAIQAEGFTNQAAAWAAWTDATKETAKPFATPEVTPEAGV